jgi:DNA repair protein RecO (recombination protein O)
MVALTVGNWHVADATGATQRRECSGLVAAHLQWHLERGLRSLPLVDRSGDNGVDPTADPASVAEAP